MNYTIPQVAKMIKITATGCYKRIYSHPNSKTHPTQQIYTVEDGHYVVTEDQYNRFWVNYKPIGGKAGRKAGCL